MAVTSAQMDTDNGIDLQVTPKDDLGTSLAGAFPYTWTTSDATIVSFGTPDRRNRIHLIASKPGKVTVEVSLPGGAKTAVVVTVKQGTNTSSGTGGEGAQAAAVRGARAAPAAREVASEDDEAAIGNGPGDDGARGQRARGVHS